MRRISIFVFLLLSAYAYAEVFESDGIYYETLSDTTAGLVKASYVDNWYSHYDGCVTIPSSVTYNSKSYKVTEIGTSALQGQANVTSIVFPSSIIAIRDRAFSGCTSLKEIVFPDDCALKYIGKEAFCTCKRLTSVYIPDNVQELGEACFKDCHALLEVSGCGSLYKLGHAAFQKCIQLTSININAEDIDDLAFWECSNLRKVTIGSNVKRIGNQAFMQCSSLSDVIIGSNVEEIGYEAFRWCLALKEINMPNSVFELGEGVFRYCTGLEYVKLSYSIEEIPAWAFEQTALKEITIPSSVVTINSFAFIECKSLASVIINEGLENIMQDAFSYTGIENVILPNSLREIGVGAFRGCDNIVSIDIPENVIKISDYAFSKCPNLGEAHVRGIIPPAIPYTTGIFSQCKAPVKVYVQDGCKSIYETNVGWAANVDNGQTVIIESSTTGINDNVIDSGEKVIYNVTGKVYIVKKNGKNVKVIIRD